MTSKHDPAFPRDHVHPGMDLRDYFAAKALQGLLADSVPFEGGPEEIPDLYARTSYDFADAMLRAREVQP